jgi:hypothetical protein
MKALFAALVLVAVAGSATVAQLGEPSCYTCFPAGGGCLICSLLQSYGGETCAQPDCYTCYLGGECAIAGGCFLAGTLIETLSGPKPIEELAVGDEVISVNESGGIQSSVIEDTYKVIQCGYYVINGKMRVTRGHPFNVGGDWVNTENLHVGDMLSSELGQPIRVESIEAVNSVRRAYNIEVAETHTFVAAGVLVHNKGPDPNQ